MNYSEIMQAIEKATSFDLFRLSVALNRMLDDPQRVQAVKRALKLDQEIEYFDPTENRLTKAKIIKIRRTKIVVENLHDKQRWNIPYYYINTENVDTTITENQKGLGRNEVKVGDLVGFRSKDGQDKYGKVIRLNKKSVTLDCGNNSQWRVSYSLLFNIVAPDVERLNNPSS